MKRIRHSLITKGLAVVGFCMNLTGCSDAFDTSYFDKEINDINFKAGIPIGYSTYTAKELFQEIGEDLQVGEFDDDGKTLISFNYTKSIKEDPKSTKDIVSIDETKSSEKVVKIDLPGIDNGIYLGPKVRIPTTGFKPYVSNTDISTTKANLTSITIDSGEFDIDITNNIGAEVTVQLLFNSISKDGVLLKTSPVTLAKGASSTFSSISLKDYIMDLKNGPDQFNTVVMTLKTAVTIKNGDVFNSSKSVTYKTTYKNTSIKYAEGDFKKTDFEVENKNFDIDFFDKIGDGYIIFKNPMLTLKATNDYGFPIGVSLGGISATNGTKTNNLIINNESKKVFKNNDTDDIDNDYYAIIDRSITNGTPTNTNIVLNNTNSNIANLLNAKPTQFNLNVSAISNPNSLIKNTNFYDKNHGLKMDVNIQLPLYVNFNQLKFTTEPFDINTDDLEKNLKSLTLLATTKNTIPLSGTVSLEFINISNDIETTKFRRNAYPMDAAPINSNGYSMYTIDDRGDLLEGNNVIAPKHSSIKLSKEEIELLKDVTHIKAVILFDTPKKSDQKTIAAKIQTSDQVRFDLALKADVTISSKDKNN